MVCCKNVVDVAHLFSFTNKTKYIVIKLFQKHIVMELFQKIKNKKRWDPTCRIRTSDLRMSVRDQLQSSALPTELRSDFDIAYQLLTYSIFYFYYIAKWKGKEKHQRVQTSEAITNAIGTGLFILLLQRAERGRCLNVKTGLTHSPVL